MDGSTLFDGRIRWTFVSGQFTELWGRHRDGDRLGSPVSRDRQPVGRRRSLASTETGCPSGVVCKPAGLAARGLQVDYRTVWDFVHSERLT